MLTLGLAGAIPSQRMSHPAPRKHHLQFSCKNISISVKRMNNRRDRGFFNYAIQFLSTVACSVSSQSACARRELPPKFLLNRPYPYNSENGYMKDSMCCTVGYVYRVPTATCSTAAGSFPLSHVYSSSSKDEFVTSKYRGSNVFIKRQRDAYGCKPCSYSFRGRR